MEELLSLSLRLLFEDLRGSLFSAWSGPFLELPDVRVVPTEVNGGIKLSLILSS